MDLQELTRLYDFTGRTFVVTGGTGVLGGEVVCALAGVGANVVILDRNLAPAEGLMERMGPHACNALALYGDVLSRESLVEANAHINERFGCVHGLINAAGGNKPTATTGPDLSFFDLPEDALRFVFDLNLMGTILPSQVFGRQLAECGEGVILNFSSMSAFRPLTRIAGYSAAKAGVSNFTQWLAVHMAQNYSPRIRVECPGAWFLPDRAEPVSADRSGNRRINRARPGDHRAHADGPVRHVGRPARRHPLAAFPGLGLRHGDRTAGGWGVCGVQWGVMGKQVDK